MAPRSGIRGVTLDDVADVADQGSSVMRGGYTFSRPGSQPAFSLNVSDLIKGMTATPINTAGQKYSGFPTATAQEAAILGSIVPFYAIGDYARQLAEQRLGEIGSETASDVRRMYGPEMLQQNALSPIAIPGSDRFVFSDVRGVDIPGVGNVVLPGVGNVAPAQVARGNVADPAYQAAELAANQAWRDLGIAKLTGGLPGKLQEYQELLDEGFQLEPAQQQEYEDLWRAQRGTAQDIFAKQQAAEKAQADLALLSRNLTSSRLAGATGRAAEAGQQVAQEVTPGMEFAQQVAEVPRYQLAQQMATQYFGMDPALAAGTFTPAVDVSYMDMMRDYEKASQLARGIDPNASVEDTLLLIDPSGQRLADYQQEIALQKEQALYEGANTAAEDEYDATIELATGFSVKQAAGDLPLATARAFLSDSQFVNAVQESIAAMSSGEFDAGLTNSQIIQQITSQYAREVDPVAAVILGNILASFEYVIPPAG